MEARSLDDLTNVRNVNVSDEAIPKSTRGRPSPRHLGKAFAADEFAEIGVDTSRTFSTSSRHKAARTRLRKNGGGETCGQVVM